MKKTTKAVLCSLLIFPGTGHFLIRRGRRGLIWLLCFGMLTYTLLRECIDSAQQLVMNLDLNSGFDLTQLISISNEITSKNANIWIGTLTWLWIIVWLVAAADVYRLAKQTGTS